MYSTHYTPTFEIDAANKAATTQKAFLHPLIEMGAKDLVNGCLAIITGGIIAGVLAFLSNGPHTPMLSAASAGAATLYMGGLSGAKHIKDFLALVIPAIVVWCLVLSDINNGLLVGFSLFVHAATTFYGSLSKPNSAITELGLWPGLMGFHWVLLGFWAIN